VVKHGVWCVPCEGERLENVCTIELMVDLFVSWTGYFTVKGCEGASNLTLHLTAGKLYKFNQGGSTNWYHLVGFAYEANGAHVGVDKLEPGVTVPVPTTSFVLLPCTSWTASTKASTATLVEISLVPHFFYPLQDWETYGVFETHFKWDIEDFAQDLFYFCHVHAGMSARIKLLDQQGNMLNPKQDYPPLSYQYPQLSQYNQ
jgi:hypothetical protein